MTVNATFDLRSLAPPQRHQLAFQCFDTLATGEFFDLINDHEPRGLLAQFLQQRPAAFDWQVLEAGPVTWRIRVRRTGDAFAPTVHSDLDAGCCNCSCRGN
jgi:uncharacterized protein (DUF2249 family)